jgi:hypothetical protein
MDRTRGHRQARRAEHRYLHPTRSDPTEQEGSITDRSHRRSRTPMGRLVTGNRTVKRDLSYVLRASGGREANSENLPG